MIINKLIGDVFINEVDLEQVETINDQHQSEYNYEISEVYDEHWNLITEYDEKLLRRAIDAKLKDEF